VIVGYSGGKKENPTYNNILDYTEAVRIIYDTSILSYSDILEEMMIKHDSSKSPYSLQYRSAIFYHNDEQKEIAYDVIESMSKYRRCHIYTDIENSADTAFYRAEEYHQKYIDKQQYGGEM
jgi:methionine-S-sulfoxide reductase